jgi:peptidoglycan-associated lipoprotein
MRTTSLAIALLTGIVALGGTMSRAQDKTPSPSPSQGASTDLAATYSTEQGQVTPSGAGSFWFQGGSLDGAITFYRGFGFAANLTGEHASRIAPGVGLNEIDFLVGPRYTLRMGSKSKHESRVFGEALLGGARGMSSVFPKATGLDTHASSFAYQVGGGLDIAITKHIAIRVVEADYVRSYLPNNGADTQGRLRLGFGVTYHSQR